MSDFSKAMPYVLINEGTKLFEDPQTGEISKFGISLKWLKTVQPDATADDVRNMTQTEAEALYKEYWWDALKMSLINSDRVATKTLDMAVNMGAQTGIKLLQQATINLAATENRAVPNGFECDGHLGPISASAINASPEEELLGELVQEATWRYQSIVEKNPAQAKNLPGWLARAAKLPS